MDREKYARSEGFASGVLFGGSAVMLALALGRLLGW